MFHFKAWELSCKITRQPFKHFDFNCSVFGVQTGRESFVQDLLHTDNGLKDFALRSTQLLSEAVKSNNVEMMKLLLKLGLDVLRSKNLESTKGRLLRDCTSISISKLLSKEVAVPVSKDSSVKSIGDSALLSAIQRRDIEIVQFLIKAGANVNVFVNDGCTEAISGLVDKTEKRKVIF
jgi:ankyrin repeat protein